MMILERSAKAVADELCADEVREFDRDMARAILTAALDQEQMKADELIAIAKGLAERDGYGPEDWLNGNAGRREFYVQMAGKTMQSVVALLQSDAP